VQQAKFYMIPYFEEVGIGDTCFYTEQVVFPEQNALTHTQTNTNTGNYKLCGKEMFKQLLDTSHLHYHFYSIPKQKKTFRKEGYIEFGGIICIHEQKITFCSEGNLYFKFCCFLYVPTYCDKTYSQSYAFNRSTKSTFV
jgi:hypothetical protein